MINKFTLTLALIFTGANLVAQQKGATPLAGSQPSTTSGQTYAVVVGISDYQDKDIPDLRFADKDAEAFANYLRSPAGGKLDNDHLKVLTNQQATMAKFGIALDWLMESAMEGDKVIIYFSGHGDVEKKTLTQPGFLLCWDAPARVYISGGAFALPMLQEVVSTISIQNKAKVIVITDACRSGKLAGSSVNGSQATASNLSKQFANEIKIMSCQSNEYSIEGEQWGGGRGAFSFHLIDALYGLADINGDQFVTLQEAGRYIEDHVSNEVAPVSQVPMIIGNRNERLTSVDEKLLSSIKSGKTNQMAMLTAIASKGIEEEVLKGLDTSIRKMYQLFKKALNDKIFLSASVGEPENNCANAYYNQLIHEPKLERLYSTMQRNFAAALQDDAQQVINIWLAADAQQLECIGKTLKLQPIPLHLQRAAELLGDRHYMYRSLQARKFLFEGILKRRHQDPNPALAQECLSLFRKSTELEPQSPVPWHQMNIVYVDNLHQPDSGLICVRNAHNLAPNWALPYVDLAMNLSKIKRFDLAKKALMEASSIDSLHPYVIEAWAAWYSRQPGKANAEKAWSLLEEYKERGGFIYPCWYQGYSDVLRLLGKHAESEKAIKLGLSMNPSSVTLLNNLGFLYFNARNYNEAEPIFKKVIEMVPTYALGWYNLGALYTRTSRFAEAEEVLNKAVNIDSLSSTPWQLLGNLYINTGRFAQAEPVLKKAIALDSLNVISWGTLADLYSKTRRFNDAVNTFNKALELDSFNATLTNNFGLVYINMRQYEKAESIIKKAIALDSMNVFAWNNLGAVYVTLGRYDEAEPVLKKAIAVDSTYANPNKHLGIVYFKTNRLKKAGQSFQKAISLNPNYLGSYLGMAYLLAPENKKTSEAIGYVEKAIQKGMSFEQLEQDSDLGLLRASPDWNALMKKHFPDKIKD